MERDFKNKNNLSIWVWMPLLFALFLVGGIFIGTQLNQKTTIVVHHDNHLQKEGLGQGKIEELIRYIESKYVDGVERDVMVDHAINEVLNQLDPHSAYISTDQLASVNEQLNGAFDGIGVEFLVIEDTVMITNVLEDGPSAKSGLLNGDRIVGIEDTIVAGQQVPTAQIMDLLRGPSGSKVNVNIWRPSEGKTFKFTIERGEIPIKSIDAGYLIKPNIAYIKINRFSANTYQEFLAAMEDMARKDQPIDLILDLRDNHGGFLLEATNILSQIIKKADQLLVYTEGAHVRRNNYETTGNPYFNIEDVVVLINEESASASEILAGAIQDYDRGIIIGRRSYGKGLVQEQYNLKDGSAIRLTVARYYTPSGRSIQRPYESIEQYNDDFQARIASGDLFKEEIPPSNIADSLVFYTKKGRKVYGNGGIKPDLFVPLDSVLMNPVFNQLVAYTRPFAFRYLEQANMEAWPLKKDFVNEFKVDDQLFKDFLSYFSSKNGNLVDTVSVPVHRQVKRFLKARIAGYAYQDDAYYKVINQNDLMLDRAIEVLNKPNPLSLLNID